MRPDLWDELIELAERVAGPGVGSGDLPGTRNRREEQFTGKRSLRVKLPGGSTAHRRTRHNYTLAVVVLVPADDVLPEHWAVYRWTTSPKLADRGRRDAQRAGFFTIEVLPVVDLQDPPAWYLAEQKEERT